MKTLPTQPLRDLYWMDVESQMKSIFYTVVFAPIMEIIRKASPLGKELTEMLNAKSGYGSLLLALRMGRVQYKDGIFSGDFSVAISKDLRAMGASFDHRSKVYRLSAESVPPVIKSESASYYMTAQKAHEEIKRKLNDMQKELERGASLYPVDADETIRRIEKGFMQSAQLLEVQPMLGRQQTQELSKDYTKNLNLYIRDFSKQSIVALREAVEDNALEGYRFDKLVEQIRHRYGVTANKAKFLARQETSLFMAKYRKQRFTQSGVIRYKWRTAHDERVRDSHKHLDGIVFSYDHPPITDRTTGERNNPGEDFNCRCVDVPLLEVA